MIIDPVYSGKAMAGMLDHIRRGTFHENEDVVFLHTGGSTSLFGYKQLFLGASLGAHDQDVPGLRS